MATGANGPIKSEFEAPKRNRTAFADSEVERMLGEMDAQEGTRERFWRSPGPVQTQFLNRWRAFKAQAERKGGPKALERLKKAQEKRERRQAKRREH